VFLSWDEDSFHETMNARKWCIPPVIKAVSLSLTSSADSIASPVKRIMTLMIVRIPIK
jgi:hypothetical protein